MLKLLLEKLKQEGFTLAELIVVVVIIGILSSIAIPSFQNASDKAKQKEVSTLISAIKAAQAYKTEYGGSLFYTNQLGEYVSTKSLEMTHLIANLQNHTIQMEIL